MSTQTLKAALTVAARSVDTADCRELLAMLGLLDTATAPKQRSRKRRGRPTKDYGHGHPLTYAKGCRCAKCRAANAARWRARLASATADPARADRAGHGRPYTYKNHGCRCPACTAANSEKCREYRERRRAKAGDAR